MSFSVLPYQTGPIHSQNHMESQKANILQNHVISSLQECGVNGHHRNHPLLGKASCHRDSVFLSNAHIEKPLRKGLFEFQQACTAGHGGSNGTNPGIPAAQQNH